MAGPELLDRDRELQAVDGLVAEAADGEARLVLIEGAAGIGKTRLLSEARRRAEAAGMRALTARGSELEREFAFGVVRQLFEPVLGRNGERELLLAGAAESAEAVFSAPVGEDAGDTSFAALHGLYWLAVNLTAEAPLALVVDDLHWCDRASLRFLAYFSRRLEGLPVLAAASLRPAEPGADPALMAELANDPVATTLRPGPLGEAAVAELVRERLGEGADDAFVAACARASGGNPLILGELLRALESEGVAPDGEQVDVVRRLGPRAASRSVLLRLARLPQDAVAVARAAALLGDGTDLSAVAALAELDEPRAGEATRDLARAEILRPEPPLGFVHPLIREAVLRDLGPGERELGHGRAARMLAEREAPPEQVAAHILAMPRRGDPWAVKTLRLAARTALRSGGADSAVSYLRRALEEPPDAEHRRWVELDLGLAESLTSGPEAAGHLRAAYDATDDPTQRGWIAMVLGQVLLFTGSGPEAGALVAEARAALPEGEIDLALRLQALLISVDNFGPAGGALPPEHDFEPGTSLGADMLAAVEAHARAMRNGGAERCAELALAALRSGRLIAEDNGSSPTEATMIALMLAGREEAGTYTKASLAEAHRRGSLFAATAAQIFRGWWLRRSGELVDAEEMLVRASQGIVAWGFGGVMLFPASALAEVRAERGDLAGAWAALALPGFPEGAELPPSAQVSWWVAAKLRVLLAEGRAEEALALADLAGERFGAIVLNPAWLPWRSARAEALHRLDRADEARAAAADELDAARAWGAPTTVGRSLRVLGAVRGQAGLADLEEAVALLEGTPERLELAKALAALGTAMRLARRPTDAREPLRRALELATVCGAEPLAEHARTELHAAGVRPRREALSGVESLTPSERRVADLAAAGRTNRDVAQELFVTPKTVEVHLSNAYRKLGIRSRRELAGALA
jgi:DNA-binding CsgD family transcriptional regulator